MRDNHYLSTLYDAKFAEFQILTGFTNRYGGDKI